ncbi:CPBP family intramembrane glutamic endopeptidase [Marinicrinis lubricantis]|uniref:CPBP family intramembrane glutamic endopeptidase n=1 Tax=Marinicrinis lubricantis TaxID=2086470 RepID=A0ABW1IKN6_9BACL
MSQIGTILLAVLLTFSHSIIKGIAAKVAQALGNRQASRYFVYIWGIAAIAAALFMQNNFVYRLPTVDRTVILAALTIAIVNLFVAKYSGYRPVGRLNVINFIVFYPIFEEVVFRGLILPVLNEIFPYAFMEIAYLPVSFSVIISAFLFAIAHFQYYQFGRLSIRYMSFAFIGGIFFGAIANVTQSILIPVLLHIEYNLLSACYSFKYDKEPEKAAL